MLPRPSDAAIAALCERGVARRLTGRWGLSRVLHAMVNESFGEMRRLPPSSGKKLGAAITTMAWDALREQIETPPVIGAHDELLMRVKAYIEANLADPRASASGESRKHAAFPPSCAAPPFHQIGRIRIALSLAASAHPLRRGASRPEPGASLDNRRLLLTRLQQFVAFQPAVQGSVRSSASSLSRRAGLPPSGDPGSKLVHGTGNAAIATATAATPERKIVFCIATLLRTSCDAARGDAAVDRRLCGQTLCRRRTSLAAENVVSSCAVLAVADRRDPREVCRVAVRGRAGSLRCCPR